MINLPDKFIARSNRLINLDDFSSVSYPIIIDAPINYPTYPSGLYINRQYILRMMIQSDELELSIPNELKWIELTVIALRKLQIYNGLNNPFIYVTVRHGLVTTTTDDVWHVDGFSMRQPCYPDQNYIYSNCYPTEYLLNSWNIPSTFDPLKHNIHYYFQDNEHLGNLTIGKSKQIYLIDPYCVHRRPFIPNDVIRTMWRISFLPIEIEDNTCTQNPLFPKKIYTRQDIREKLVAWKGNQ
jgi:hypothetical protein